MEIQVPEDLEVPEVPAVAQIVVITLVKMAVMERTNVGVVLLVKVGRLSFKECPEQPLRRPATMAV